MAETGQSGLNVYLQNQGRLYDLSWVDKYEGSPHEPTWICVCKILGQQRGVGRGPKKHMARDVAANAALASLMEEERGTADTSN